VDDSDRYHQHYTVLQAFTDNKQREVVWTRINVTGFASSYLPGNAKFYCSNKAFCWHWPTLWNSEKAQYAQLTSRVYRHSLNRSAWAAIWFVRYGSTTLLNAEASFYMHAGVFHKSDDEILWLSLITAKCQCHEHSGFTTVSILLRQCHTKRIKI